MPQPRSVLFSALAQLSDANRALQLRLEENQSLIRKALAMTSKGVSVSAVLEEIPVHAAQMAADDAMVVLFEARDRARKVVICEGIEDGMTVEQVAAMFHASPDLIGSYVAEGSNKFSQAILHQG